MKSKSSFEMHIESFQIEKKQNSIKLILVMIMPFIPPICFWKAIANERYNIPCFLPSTLPILNARLAFEIELGPQ